MYKANTVIWTKCDIFVLEDQKNDLIKVRYKSCLEELNRTYRKVQLKLQITFNYIIQTNAHALMESMHRGGKIMNELQA